MKSMVKDGTRTRVALMTLIGVLTYIGALLILALPVIDALR